MFSSKLLVMVLVTAFFQGANSCAVDAHTSPGVGAQQSNRHNGERSYTLIFCNNGVSKGDVAADKSVTLIGAADTVVATGEKSLKLMRGSCMIVAADSDVKVDLSKLAGLTVSAHGKAILSKVNDNIYVVVKAGSATVTAQGNVSNLPAGSAVVISNSTVQNAVCETTQNPIFTNKQFRQGSEPVRLLADNGTKFTVKDGALWLKDASAFVEMPGGVKLVTPGGTIHSAHPYTISCRLVDDALCIENCSPTTIVEMTVKEEKFKVPPFKCCSLKYGDEKQATIPDDGVLRRDVVAESDGKLNTMVSEYDPLSLVEAHTELKRAVSKPITLHQQETCEALFKSIAVFQELCGDLDSFEETPKIAIRSVKGRVTSKNNGDALSVANTTRSRVQ